MEPSQASRPITEVEPCDFKLGYCNHLFDKTDESMVYSGFLS